jgi:A/G-specific adenine glycosylase
MNDFAHKLLTWFDQHGRKDLPWQRAISPYKVWVSEIMLQQTQVATVLPYFDRFMTRFPSVDQLAEASEDEVLHQWTGLGYYARARNLHATAKTIVMHNNGEFPMTQAELEALPGIGRSTAGAILSICDDQPAAILDGNVKRVLARCFTIEGWPGASATAKALWAQAEELTPTTRNADYTQAIMDLGAMTCTRSSPNCEQCPFTADCLAKKNLTIDQYPGKKPKKIMPVRQTLMLVLELHGAVLLQKRPSKGLWGGLWSFPECNEAAEIEAVLASLGLREIDRHPLSDYRHTFSHYHLDITPIHILIESNQRVADQPADQLWFDTNLPPAIGLTKPVSKLLESLTVASAPVQR